MPKTKSQVLHPPIKEEECEDKPRLKRLLHGTNNKSKITENKTVLTKPMQAQIAKVKTENTDDNKPNSSPPRLAVKTGSKITIKQITKVIGYIVNDKMSINAASKKAGMSDKTAQRYYQEYKSDPEHKIPLPKTNFLKPSSRATQRKIEDFIYFIIHDKMCIHRAAIEAKISKSIADKYYKQYREDPDRKIPTLRVNRNLSYKRFTQEEIKKLIGYIVNSNMSVAAAAKKVNMSTYTAKKYYLKYLEDPNHNLPVPGNTGRGISSSKSCTNEQVKQLIGYIVDDRVTLLEASVKANMSTNTASKYYQQYLDDPNHNIPTPETDNKRSSKNYPTLDQIRNFFSFIIIDELNIYQASLKANISTSTGFDLHKRHLKNPTKEVEGMDNSYSVEKMKKLVEYIQKEKICLNLASKKANIARTTARRFYQQYLKDPQLGFPKLKVKQFTQEDIKRLIGYIENDKMSIQSAAIKNKMNTQSAYKYYRLYQNDPEHRVPVPPSKQKTSNKYSQIIADIYKNKPLIKPMQDSHHKSNSELSDIHIKQESFETKEESKNWV